MRHLVFCHGHSPDGCTNVSAHEQKHRKNLLKGVLPMKKYSTLLFFLSLCICFCIGCDFHEGKFIYKITSTSRDYDGYIKIWNSGEQKFEKEFAGAGKMVIETPVLQDSWYEVYIENHDCDAGSLQLQVYHDSLPFPFLSSNVGPCGTIHGLRPNGNPFDPEPVQVEEPSQGEE
jgi:hypothetical protein